MNGKRHQPDLIESAKTVAAQSIDPSFAEQSQRVLLNRLETADRRVHRARWLVRVTACAATAAVLVLVLILPLGTPEGVAFAEVRAYFQNFESLTVRFGERKDEEVVWTSKLVMDNGERMRLEQGEVLTMLWNPAENASLSLDHRRRTARITQSSAERVPRSNLGWLDYIREYQGEAVAAKSLVEIDGHRVHAYKLKDNALDGTIWATPEGRPVAMEMQSNDSRKYELMKFTFDEPLAEDTFSYAIPAGYTTTTTTSEERKEAIEKLRKKGEELKMNMTIEERKEYEEASRKIREELSPIRLPD